MPFIRVLFIAVAGLFFVNISSAQTTGSETKKGDINFTEMATYYAEHPLPFKRRLPFDENEESEPGEQPEPDPSQVHPLNRSARQINTGMAASPLPPSTAPVDTFLGVISDGSDIPPDTHGAVSPEYCVTVTNYEMHILNRGGKGIQTLPLDGFWTSVLPAGTDAFDPKIVYDPYYKRWVLVTDAVNQTTMGTSTLLIAVSETCNPLGIWHRYAITIDPTNTLWLDFPNIGFNTRWVTITGNMFNIATGHGQGTEVYVVDYAGLMSGSGATFTEFTQASPSFTLCPAITYDATLQNMFMLEVSNGGTGKLQLWKISGPTGTPALASVGFPTSTEHWKGSGPGAEGFAEQLGTADKIDAGDNRITRVAFRNNSLWCAHTIFLPATGTVTRCAIMWWQIDTLANPIQNGTIDDPVTPSFYCYPSIAVNANNDAMIGFAYLTNQVYPSCAYAMRKSADPLDSLRPAVIYRHGQTNYFQNFGSGLNRWGDFSATNVDPINDTDFWTVQESVPTSPANVWDTWWAHIQLANGIPGLGAAYDTVDAYVTDLVKFTGTISPGSVFTWSFNGGTGAPGTGTGNQNVTWTATGEKIITLTDSVPGCTLVFTDTILVRPASSVKNVTATEQDIQIVPNPSNGVFNILFSKQLSDPANINIMDMQGRVVYTNQFVAAANDKVSIETNNLAPGSYIANIDINNIIITKKITIDR